MKINKHSVCSWTWSIDYDPESADTESGYVVILEKVHPTFEWLRHVKDHLIPPWARVIVEHTPWWVRYEERSTNDIMRVAITDEMAAELCLPLWQCVNEVMADFEGDDSE